MKCEGLKVGCPLGNGPCAGFWRVGDKPLQATRGEEAAIPGSFPEDFPLLRRSAPSADSTSEPVALGMGHEHTRHGNRLPDGFDIDRYLPRVLVGSTMQQARDAQNFPGKLGQPRGIKAWSAAWRQVTSHPLFHPFVQDDSE